MRASARVILRVRKFFAPDGGVKLVPGSGRLSIDRNEISRLVLGGRPLAQLREMAATKKPGTIDGIYRAAYVAQNRFTSGVNRMLAKDVRLTDNLFDPVDTDLGAALADTATYVGNGAVEPATDFKFHDVTRSHKPKDPGDLNTMSIV